MLRQYSNFLLLIKKEHQHDTFEIFHAAKPLKTVIKFSVPERAAETKWRKLTVLIASAISTTRIFIRIGIEDVLCANTYD